MLHKLHRISAVVIGAFVLVHLINHLFILDGVQSHIEFMDAFRQVYRHMIAESILLLCVIFQIFSGIYFVWRRWGQRSSFIEKAQAFSGLYLAFFFLNHVGAVLYGRVIAQLDTNIYFGIAGFHNPPFHFYFIPYYFLAVVAIFVHIAAAFNWLCRNKISSSLRSKLAYTIMATGCLLSLLLILGFNGWFNEIVIPQKYNDFYG
ncbi:hypothetical protein [Simiduia aestuariiviva]|uniref:Succinate dehydrogenase/fumarate reductase cytochrome b subunit n=1 Tax=Simiduia aestuariiviva TaxID=1510459 RepID=A0A839USK8_9GAMM|nr:hypothetical protein [Simiduia aestuariiviva]MBB3169450.1 succinate dehydrogenase/fumarate reductase cytochrome b subunit [Simiduia aestuariiviva]